MKHICVTLAALCVFLQAFSREVAEGCGSFERTVSFRFDSAVLEKEFRDNAKTLKDLDSVLTSLPPDRLISIDVLTASSPEGSYQHNVNLSKGRSEAIADYFRKNYPGCYDKISFEWKDEAWDDLRILVREDTRLSQNDKKAIFHALDEGVPRDTRKWRMARLSTYNYLRGQLFPQLRSSAVVVISTLPASDSSDASALSSYARERADVEPATPAAEDTAATVPAADTTAITGTIAVADTIITAPAVTEDKTAIAETLTGVPDAEAAAMAASVNSVSRIECPPFALKTNLLFDAALAFNVELEVPIGPHVSLAAEWTAPWWLDEENKWCYEANVGNIEARWWWGDRSVRPMFSGWFTSIYADTGKYDFQNSEKGRQGVFWNVGAGGGYAWTLGSSWGLEAMVGLGFFDTRYETYVPREEYSILAYRQTLNTSMFGPTRAKVSIFYKFGQRWYDRKYRHGDE